MITRRDHLTTAKVDEMSVTVNESPIQYYTHSEVDFPTSRAQTSSRARTGLFSMFSAAKKERESGSSIDLRSRWGLVL